MVKQTKTLDPELVLILTLPFYSFYILVTCAHIFRPISPVVKAFQEYSEPEDATPSSPQRRAATGGEDEAVVLPLGDNTLTHNLGIPVLIVCTKVRGVLQLQRSGLRAVFSALLGCSHSSYFLLFTSRLGP